MPRPDERSGPRRRRRRRLLAVLTILVVLYAALGFLPMAWAALNIGDSAKAAADAAGQGNDPSRAAVGNMPGLCRGLGVTPDEHNFHKGGTVTVSLTCTLDTPWFGWFGLHQVHVGSTGTSPVVVDHPYRFAG